MQLSSLPGGRILTNGRNEKIGFVFKKVAMVPSLLHFLFCLLQLTHGLLRFYRVMENPLPWFIIYRRIFFGIAWISFFLSFFLFSLPLVMILFCVRHIGQLGCFECY